MSHTTTAFIERIDFKRLLYGQSRFKEVMFLLNQSLKKSTILERELSSRATER